MTIYTPQECSKNRDFKGYFKKTNKQTNSKLSVKQLYSFPIKKKKVIKWLQPQNLSSFEFLTKYLTCMQRANHRDFGQTNKDSFKDRKSVV